MTEISMVESESPGPVIVLSGATVRAGMHDQEELVGRELDEALRATPGFISCKTYTADDGEVLSVFRFETEQDVVRWRDHRRHLAYQKATDDYYESFWVQTALVYRAYEWRDGAKRELPPDPAFRRG